MGQLDRPLLRVVDAGLAACILLVPLVMGGRHAAGQLTLIALALTVALAWTFRQCLQGRFHWRRSPAELFVLAGLVVLILQLLPVSPSVLNRISPHTAAVLPLWTATGDAALGPWPCVSMTPAGTRAAIPLFLAYGLVLLVTVQRVQGVEDVEQLLRWIGLSAVLMACLGLLQWAAGNGKFFWFYQPPFSDTLDGVKGSFTNRNHFAQFLAFGVGPLLWWLQHAARESTGRPGHAGSAAARRSAVSPQCSSKHPLAGPHFSLFRGQRSSGALEVSPLRILTVALVVFAGLMSLSRGGAMAMLTAVTVSLAIGYWAKALGPRVVVGLGALVLLTAVSLAIHGYQPVSNRLGELTSGSLETMDRGRGRRAIWAADLRAISDYLPLGSGVGSHAEVYPMYLEAPLDFEYTHAENSPIQVFLETGLPGLGLMLAAIGACGLWCIGTLRACSAGISPPLSRRGGHPAMGSQDGGSPRRRVLLCAGAISASLAANLVHAMVDFVWYVPGCMILVVILAGCACRLWQLSKAKEAQRRPVELPVHAAALAALVLAAGGLGIVAERVGPTIAQVHWERFQALERGEARSPQLKTPAQDQAAMDTLRHRIDELEKAVGWDPDHARAHLQLAICHLRRFDLRQQASECGMPLHQIRDAAEGGFATREQYQQWLSRVLAERRADLDRAGEHTRRTLRLCPLQGEAYLYLAQLCFLDEPARPGVKPACLAQALAVRPFDGGVLLEAGREASLAGDVQLAFAYWRRCFHAGPAHRQGLIELMADRFPVRFLLESLQPDLDSLRALHVWYCKLGRQEEAGRLCSVYHQCTDDEPAGPEGDARQAKTWLDGQLSELRRFYVRAAEEEADRLAGPPAADAWLEAASIRGQMSDAAGQLQSIDKALRCDPSGFRARYAMAQAMISAGRFADAESHLTWCAKRRPGDASLEAVLRDTVKKRIDQEGRTAGAGPGLGARR